MLFLFVSEVHAIDLNVTQTAVIKLNISFY
jgi:hypothetical protein